MDWLSQLDAQKFLLFTLVFTRVGGLVITAPVFSTPEVPARVRALLAVALAALITPTQWDVAVTHPGSTLNYLVFLASELIVGLSLGLGIVVLFSGLLLAGRMIGQMSGLVLADVFDPASGISVSVFSRLMLLVTTAVFVAIGGHRILMAGLLDTFVTIPPGSAAVPGSMADTFVVLVAQSFTLAVRAAAPVVASLLLSTLALGLIRGGHCQTFLEHCNLFLEYVYVGQIVAVKGDSVIVKPDLAQASGWSLVKEKGVIFRIVSLGDRRIDSRVEKVIGHELEDERDVHVNGSLKFG